MHSTPKTVREVQQAAEFRFVRMILKESEHIQGRPVFNPIKQLCWSQGDAHCLPWGEVTGG